MRTRQVIRRIERLGGVYAGTRGLHRKYVVTYLRGDGTTGEVFTAVAMHGGDVPTGTLHKIERDLEPALGKGWLTR